MVYVLTVFIETNTDAGYFIQYHSFQHGVTVVACYLSIDLPDSQWRHGDHGAIVWPIMKALKGPPRWSQLRRHK